MQLGLPTLSIRNNYGSSSDPFVGSVGSLMHMEGSEGGAVFVDEVGTTITNAILTTTKAASAKFGATGAEFASGISYMTWASSTAYQIGSAPFTVEFWAKNLNKNGADAALIVGQAPDLTAPNARWAIATDPVNPSLFFLAGTGGGTFNSVFLNIPYDTNHADFRHYAFAGDGSTLRGFVDGVLQGSAAYTAFSSNEFLQMGSSSLGNSLNGSVDEFRITKGVARYTSNFTPPTSPFPNP